MSELEPLKTSRGRDRKTKTFMNWIVSIFVGLLTGGLSLFIAGLVAVGCIEWYHISGFEGKSGYFMVAIALLGGIAGCVLGFAISRAIGAGSWLDFFKGLGISWGVVVLVSGTAAGIACLLADISPKIDGQYLELDVEIKLPVGETNQPTQLEGKPSFTLGSVVRHVQRASTEGELKLADSRLESGRWIIPASADVFTMRGLRSISARIGDKTLAAFIIPLPARPGHQFETWSEWGPRPRHGNPWPDTNPSYRFRVHRIVHLRRLPIQKWSRLRITNEHSQRLSKRLRSIPCSAQAAARGRTGRWKRDCRIRPWLSGTPGRRLYQTCQTPALATARFWQRH
jgi:hypothetical protein